MDDIRFIAKILIVAGCIIAAFGGILLFTGRVPWIGHLPGDISIQRKNFRFYFPLGTCILLSIILTIIFWLLRRR